MIKKETLQLLLTSLFFGLIINQQIVAQDVTDYISSICSSQDLEAESPTNTGINNVLTPCSGTPLSGNLAFYYIQIQSGSTFTFLLTPTNNIDFDFASWKNPDLTNLGPGDRGSQNDPTATGVYSIGLDLNATDLCEAGGSTGNPDPGLVRYYDVVPGDVILIAVDRWSGSQSGFTITFGGDAELDCVFDGGTYHECDNELDGQALFNLNEIENDIITASTNNITVTFYNNETDALAGASNTLPDNLYAYTSNNPTIVYARIVDNATGDLIRVERTFLYVEQPPNIDPITEPLIMCDDDTLDGLTTFDLTVLENQIINGQTDVTLSYYISENDATYGITPIATPDAYENTIPDDQIIYVRLEDDIYGCYAITSFMIHVESPIPGSPQNIDLCDEVTLNDLEEVFDLTEQTDVILDVNDPTEYTVTYYTSETDAMDGINQITNPDNYTNTSPIEQIFARLEENATGCYNITFFYITVTAIPEANTPTPLYGCNDGTGSVAFFLNDKTEEILDGQTDVIVTYYGSMADLQAENNELPSLYYNTSNPQTIYVLLESTIGGCKNDTTLELVVADAPTANTPTPMYFCDDDNDGFGEFYLDVPAQEVVPNDGYSYDVSFHVTQTDAENGVLAFSSPFDNTVPDSQTIYVRVLNQTTGCYDVVPLELNVITTPEISYNLEDLEVCDDNYDGFAEFDLSQQDANVYGSQSTTDFSISYYDNLMFAQQGINEIPSNYYTNYIPDVQPIYVRLENNITGCSTVRTFDLVVNPKPVVDPTYDHTLSLCDDFGQPNDQQTVFDLTVENDEITGGLNGFNITYYESLTDAEAGTNAVADDTAYTNPTNQNPYTLYVRVENSNTGCFTTTTLSLRVLNNPSPLMNNELLETCDDDLDGDSTNGQAEFDLTLNEDALLNGETNVTPTYYETYEDAFDGTNPIPNPDAYYNSVQFSQTIYVGVTNNNTGCLTITTIDLIVHPLPEVTDEPTYFLCEVDNDDVETILLTDMDSFVLDGGDATGLVINYYASESDAINDEAEYVGPYITINSTEQIYARVENTTTECFAIVSFLIDIEQAPLAFTPAPLVYCETLGADGYFNNDGLEEFNLEAVIETIRGSQDPDTYPVAIYTSLADAEAGINAIPTDELNPYITGTITLYAVVTNVNTGCTNGDPIVIELVVEPVPEVTLDNADGIICTDATNNPIIGTDLGNEYSYLWNTGETTPTIEITEAGEYFVTVTDNTTINQCAYESNHVYYEEASLPAVTPTVVQSEIFDGQNTISVTANGAGISEYGYQLDNGSMQYNGTFNNVEPGTHTVTITELNGCGSLTLEVSVVDYMKYFTPNGDGVNDTWRVIGLESQENAQVFIFDRQGKMVKQMSATSEGWNGTFNGNQLPSSDYWFKVIYTEPSTGQVKEFNSHFALKR
ncbi:T9SS type B sorting domain-containing protein [Neptunitalea lumnitzerae]|uniref:Gliding motility-associated C-terminal domain-containing protein n=1 Tax=Neptunitalea lumnitzerae TaxID=2965509 RepID=A0ABQ5MKN5_9FLAO|nr:T9SS type B sorting domain-containing protein [Neptunitalea sp. Y10]GLB49973.1 hypothetical protein Y10_23410 [Neptunitalea sp. Y10]